MAGQGANNGPSQAAGSQFVKFGRQSAQRIAKAVRIVEAGDRGQPGLTFDHPQFGNASPLKVATFTGSWAVGSWKTVTVVNTTATALVYNWCNAAEGKTNDTACTQYVVFGKANGTNSVVEITMRNTCQTCRMSINGMDLTQLPGYSAGVIQLLGHSAADLTTNNTACATLTWYSITTCSTSA